MIKPIALVLAAIRVGALNAAPAADRPNILFLSADDQRADTIAALGNPVIRTPNLNTLARGETINTAPSARTKLYFDDTIKSCPTCPFHQVTANGGAVASNW